MSSTFTPSDRAVALTLRTYSRPTDESGTVLETWDQVVQRSTYAHHVRLWEEAGGTPDLSELEELKSLGLSRAGLVAGRTLWLGGTEYAYKRSASQFNPAVRETKFITRQGVKSFLDFEHGDTVEVLTHRGNWKPAVVSRVGVRPVQRITFRRGSNRQVEEFSYDHTWILKDESRVQGLKPEDRLIAPPVSFYDWNYDDASLDEKLWWAYGFVYGDGTLVKSCGCVNSMVRLCGKKAQYAFRFGELGFSYSYPPSCNGDPIAYTGKYLKTLPDGSEGVNKLRAFVRGYLDADGNKSQSNELFEGIQATGEEACAFIEKFFPVVGLYVLSRRQITNETNYGKRSGVSFCYKLRANLSGCARTNGYIVDSVECVGEKEVWCLTVDDDHSFVLPNGVVTGNCSFLEVSTVYDVVDAAWLLLNGCGVGFKPRVGTLHGYLCHVPVVEVLPSLRGKDEKGRPDNVETLPSESNGNTWTIQVGDSAQAWAKAVGKLFNQKVACVKKLVLDFREVRGPGGRLKGYGWICNGYKPFAEALVAIHHILNAKTGDLLDDIDILDVLNHLGQILSSRRAAEIALMDASNPRLEEFAVAKREYWVNNPQRRQSNNTVMYWSRPTRQKILELIHAADECGGDPGFMNAEAAQRRAPWTQGGNPCMEICLSNHGFCNLVSLAPPMFRRNFAALERAVYLMARANYRQTCVDLRDEILQPTWHQTNESLRLCGVSMTGLIQSEWITDYQIRRLRNAAVYGAYSMADELGLPRPKAVTTEKPEGTRTKIAGTRELGELGEGLHRPLGRYIFNNTNFSVHDPLVPLLDDAGYRILPNPQDHNNVLVCWPLDYQGIKFDRVDGKEVNLEPAVAQLERYLRWNTLWADHNVSCTISYSPEEIPEVADWIHRRWDDGFVAVSLLRRTDPTKTAADLGHPYLPQEVVTEAQYHDYKKRLKRPEFEKVTGLFDLDTEECKGGVCPVK